MMIVPESISKRSKGWNIKDEFHLLRRSFGVPKSHIGLIINPDWISSRNALALFEDKSSLIIFETSTFNALNVLVLLHEWRHFQQFRVGWRLLPGYQADLSMEEDAHYWAALKFKQNYLGVVFPDFPSLVYRNVVRDYGKLKHYDSGLCLDYAGKIISRSNLLVMRES